VQIRHVHRHRVGVVQEPGVGAQVRHVAGEGVQDGEGAQAPEDAADPDRVGDGLVETEAGRDLEVAHGRLVHAHLDHVDDVVGAVERPPAIALGGDLGPRPHLVGGGLRDRLGCRQPLGIDVVQHHPGGGQLREGEHVAEKVAGEDDTARSDDHNGGSHGPRVWRNSRISLTLVRR
jgi:hypothetical protein